MSVPFVAKTKPAPERGCKTCKHWYRASPDDIWGLCKWRSNNSAPWWSFDDMVTMTEDGRNCEVWEAKS